MNICSFSTRITYIEMQPNLLGLLEGLRHIYEGHLQLSTATRFQMIVVHKHLERTFAINLEEVDTQSKASYSISQHHFGAVLRLVCMMYNGWCEKVKKIFLPLETHWSAAHCCIPRFNAPLVRTLQTKDYLPTYS